jgi:hypothetical protein
MLGQSHKGVRFNIFHLTSHCYLLSFVIIINITFLLLFSTGPVELGAWGLVS